MTFVTQDDCLDSGLPWVNMVNKAGKVVAPSVYSVQAAMAQFAANFSAGNLTIDIVDAPGNDSWPLSYTTFIAINRSITALDCTNIEELMRFIAWTQINDGYPHAPRPFKVSPDTRHMRHMRHTTYKTFWKSGRRCWPPIAAVCRST